ncbi:alpha-mannosidase 2x isoform X1 [Gallus gallus]|uniref:alpha-mannosidase 2x isoform X1 n=1 Tax=Gallus gallus TaxID=9031 RepID=UPI000240BF04|nr:alpha-mannosidase 2x isoform X1 [Gallus gallus]|eukprot:XP_001233608.2 alpha-mannosidase 2x isoform X1 [Gallus gallus]
MKLKKQVTVCGAAIFCVAVFSLYLMLDRVQHDPARHQSGGNFPRSQISVLQNRIEQLEQLLEENHEIISHIKDSVLELTAHADGQPPPPRRDNGSWALPPESRPSFLAVSPQDCQFALGAKGESPDLQMLAVYSLLPFDNQDGGVWKQGFDITYEPSEWDAEPLQVFVVPHSHNDPGWIKTFDKYYYDQTQHILNSMVLKMQEDPRRRFIWSEISFFSKWWDNISAQKRAAVRRLVGNGQLEMVTGGWVMPDEANSHYFAMIDQLIEGHQWLEKNIGVTPRSGWAVDPFGHSSTMPYLLKRSNLTGMVIQRVHYAIKKHFAATQNLEFMWRQTWDPESSTDIFCHMMPFYSYDVPHTCGPDPKICCQFDFKRLPGGRINCPWKVPPRAITEANVAERAQLLLDQYRKKSKLYRSKVLLVPLGDDFRYDKPQEWDAQFLNYQRIFDFLNAQPQLHVQAQFGTLSDYFDALYKRVGIVPGMRPPGFPVLSGDFFSYADREDHYWTGYYTSRPFYKSLDRVLEAHLRGAELLFSLALAHARRAGADSRYPLSDYSLLSSARRNLGLFQHHDAITGTAKEAVVVDYGVRLLHSLTNLKRVIINAAHYLVLGDKDTYHYDPATPFLSTDDTRLNQDSLPERTVVKLDASPRFLVVFNPLEQERLSLVPLLVDSPHVCVLSEDGQPLPAQLSAQWGSATDVVPDVYRLSILARLPALGLRVLQLQKSFDSHTTLQSSVRLYLHGRDVIVRKQEAVPVQVFPAAPDDFCLENQHLRGCFSGSSGLLQSLRRAGEEREQRVSTEFFIYGTRTSKDKSGAYLFLPDGEAKPYAPKDPPIVRVMEGPLFSEVSSYYQHVQTTVRLYNVPGVEGLSLDVSCLVDIRDHVNKELALRFSTDIESDDTFFTDLNGFQIQPRRYQQKLPLQANFYPMPTMAYIQDMQSRLTLHTAQALGVSSLGSGQLEVILDRRLMQDDNRGLGQGLKDNKRTCNRFRLLLERRSSANKVQDGRPVSFPSLLSHFTSMHLNAEALVLPVAQQPAPPALRSFAPLSTTLPCDFHILNLRTLQAEDDSLPSAEAALILHRKGFDCSLEAKNLGFNCTTSQGQLALGSLFQGLELGSLQPTSLTLMYPLGTASNSTNIQLHPMEIATFRVRLG